MAFGTNCDIIVFIGMCLTLETAGVPQITLYGPPQIVRCFVRLVNDLFVRLYWIQLVLMGQNVAYNYIK